MKNILSDSSDFSKIIKGGYVYVDKTAILHDLISNGKGSRYFISRPRRFGKSLMISTLEAIFQGRRELFEGLAIAQKGYDWKKYPVIHLDMSAVLADNIEEMKKNIVNMIRLKAYEAGVEMGLDNDTPSSSFNTFINEMARKHGSQLVVLVDEYDAPVNRLIEQDADSTLVSSVLHDFYGQLKVNDSHIRFLMMTGVSKFAKISVFSGLNNLNDLTLEPECADLLGYTIEEVRDCFSEHIQDMAKVVGEKPEATLQELIAWYDGYRFSPYSLVKVTNPVSLGSALTRKRFEPFWDETGRSTLIYKHLKNRQIVPAQLNHVEGDKSDLNFCDISDTQSPALLFQTGYLTIEDKLSEDRFRFCIPNKEVEIALNSGMLSYIYGGAKSRVLSTLNDACDRLSRDPSQVSVILNETLCSAFDAIPYDWRIEDEPEARRMFLFYCSLMGATILGEVHSSKGRADAVLEFDKAVFVFEFKYNHTAEIALEQAEQKMYAGPFMNGNRAIYLVGVNYNPEKRNIDKPLCKELKRDAKGIWIASNLDISVGASGPTGPYNGEETRAAVVPMMEETSLSSETSGKAL